MILLDTHVVLWLAVEQAKLSRKARAEIEEARRKGEGLAIADITLLEIATLARKGRITLQTTLETFLTEIESRFVVFPMTARVCARATSLPPSYPSDPADRVIAATALVEGMPLVTADEGIRKAKVLNTSW